LGDDDLATLNTRHSLALIMANRGDHAGAEAVYRDIQAANLRVLGPDHPQTLTTRHEAEVVLGVLRERGRKGLPLTQLYRQMFNKDLYLAAYGNIYSNQGAMTPGPSQETADGMSEDLIDEVIGQMRRERYRFTPSRRVWIPKKNGKLRPLGLPSWPDKLVGEVVRLLLEAYYEPRFSGRSHGSARGDGVIPRCGRYKAPGPGPRGLSRVTSPTASGRWIMK
jgi:hypothetical protein